MDYYIKTIDEWKRTQQGIILWLEIFQFLIIGRVNERATFSIFIPKNQ